GDEPAIRVKVMLIGPDGVVAEVFRRDQEVDQAPVVGADGAIGLAVVGGQCEERELHLGPPAQNAPVYPRSMPTRCGRPLASFVSVLGDAEREVEFRTV